MEDLFFINPGESALRSCPHRRSCEASHGCGGLRRRRGIATLPLLRATAPLRATADSTHPTEAKAFLDFVRSDEAQKLFAENGYRPVSTTADTAGQKFPTPSGLFTIADLGGWPSVAKTFFDPDKGIVTDIERKLGVSVEKK